jgi:hypothetical protein
MGHFHIQWAGKEDADPVVFTSHAQACETADFIAKPDEKFTITRFDGTCPVCEKLKNR